MPEKTSNDNSTDTRIPDSSKIPGSEGYGPSVYMELSKEELSDIRAALNTCERKLRDDGALDAAQDLRQRRDRVSEALDVIYDFEEGL